MKVSTIFGICFCAVLLTDIASFVMPNAPWGSLGGLAYLYHFGQGTTREKYEERTAHLARTMQISIASCDNAQGQYRQMGGDSGIRKTFYERHMAGYDRSAVVWPIFYGSMTIMLLGLSLKDFRASRHSSGGEGLPLLSSRPVENRNSNAVDKLLFK